MDYHPEITTNYALCSNILLNYIVTCSFSTSVNTFPRRCLLMAVWTPLKSALFDHFTITDYMVNSITMNIYVSTFCTCS